jgi:hypothetical protein
MKGDKKAKWFFKIRDAYYARSAIMMVKHNQKPSVGRDGIERSWIITLSAEVAPDIRFRNVWADDREIAPLLEVLEEECGKLPKIARAQAVNPNTRDTDDPTDTSSSLPAF